MGVEFGIMIAIVFAGAAFVFGWKLYAYKKRVAYAVRVLQRETSRIIKGKAALGKFYRYLGFSTK